MSGAPAPRRLALDHLTVADAAPLALVEIAARCGCAGVGLFLRSLPEVPGMPAFDLVADPAACRAVGRALCDAGLALELVYPFTLTGRSDARGFERALAAAGALGARRANVLCYDADPARRADNLTALADLAAPYEVGLALEFYPASRVRSLAEARAVVAQVGETRLGLTIDVLHLYRAGDLPGALPLLAEPIVRIAQLCDGPAIAPEAAAHEAGAERMLPGAGGLDLAGFVAALDPACPVNVEVPRDSARRAGVPPLERARQAVAATRRVLGEAA